MQAPIFVFAGGCLALVEPYGPNTMRPIVIVLMRHDGIIEKQKHPNAEVFFVAERCHRLLIGGGTIGDTKRRQHGWPGEAAEQGEGGTFQLFQTAPSLWVGASISEPRDPRPLLSLMFPRR